MPQVDTDRRTSSMGAHLSKMLRRRTCRPRSIQAASSGPDPASATLRYSRPHASSCNRSHTDKLVERSPLRDIALIRAFRKDPNVTTAMSPITRRRATGFQTHCRTGDVSGRFLQGTLIASLRRSKPFFAASPVLSGGSGHDGACDPGKVAPRRSVGGKAGGGEKLRHFRFLPDPQFQHRAPARREQAGKRDGEDAVGVEPIRSAVERETRVVLAHLLVERGDIPRGNIRRIGGHQVETAVDRLRPAPDESPANVRTGPAGPDCRGPAAPRLPTGRRRGRRRSGTR